MSDERASAEIYQIVEEGRGFTVRQLILPEGLTQEVANEAYKEAQSFFEDSNDFDYFRLVFALHKIFSSKKG